MTNESTHLPDNQNATAISPLTTVGSAPMSSKSIRIPQRLCALGHRLRRHLVFVIAAAIALLFSLYWLFIASNQYITTAHISIHKTDMSSSSSFDLGSLLSGSGSNARNDLLVMRDYLLSAQMITKLEKELAISKHYSSKDIDLFSRLWESEKTAEALKEYYRQRVQIELDEYTGLLVVKVSAFSPTMSLKITQLLVQEGERYMNQTAQGLAQVQVQFLQQQLLDLSERVQKTRRAVIAFQNQKGIVSPQTAIQSLSAVIASLEGKRAELQAQLSAAGAYLVPDHPTVVGLSQQVAAIDAQIKREQAKLASPTGGKLNQTTEEFERLNLEAQFAQDMYKSAVVALERGRIEATRTLKKVVLTQAPALAEESIYPQRGYNALIYSLFCLAIASLLQLILAIIRDHQD